MRYGIALAAFGIGLWAGYVAHQRLRIWRWQRFYADNRNEFLSESGRAEKRRQLLDDTLTPAQRERIRRRVRQQIEARRRADRRQKWRNVVFADSWKGVVA